MKKILKLFGGMLAVMLVILAVSPTEPTFAAVKAPSAVSFYHIPNGGDVSFNVTKVTKKTRVDVASIVSSDPSVLTIDRLETQLAASGKKGNKCTIYLHTVKAGSAVVSYKIGKKEYKTTVTVLPYENPLKSMTFTNVNGGADLAGLTSNGINTDTYGNKSKLALSETTKHAKLHFATNTGWKVKNAKVNVDYAYNTEKQPYAEYRYCGKKNWTDKTLSFSRLYKVDGGYSYLSMDVYNTKTKQTVNLSYYIY